MKTSQVIYYGAPGTGKSYAVDNLEEIKKAPKEQVFRTTFHPEYSYSDFTGQLLPIVKKDTITYEYQRGVFTNALKKAFEDTSKPVFLIIEEMSRGNVAAIFGDIFQLLDRDDKNKSRYPVRNSIIAKEIIQMDDTEELIYLPGNFNIFGTVNTSDQNVFVMDTAFKRRFDWKYISTDPVKNNDGSFFENDNISLTLFSNAGNVDVKWHEFYMKLNKFITDKNKGLGLSEDKQIGQFFIQFSKEMDNDSTIKDKIQNKLMQYLWEDVESASYGNEIKLFSSGINSYSDLYRALSKDEQIFSNDFFVYYSDFAKLPDDVL